MFPAMQHNATIDDLDTNVVRGMGYATVEVCNNGMIVSPQEWRGIPSEWAESHGLVWTDYLLKQVHLTKAGIDKLSEIKRSQAEYLEAQRFATVQGWCA
jgi:hypothetical protein